MQKNVLITNNDTRFNKPVSFSLLKEHDYSGGGSDDIIMNQKAVSAADDVIYKMLLELRKKISQQKPRSKQKKTIQSVRK